MFKYAVNSNSIRKALSSAEIAKLAKDVGLDGIEWGLPAIEKAGEEIKEMARLTADQGLSVAGYINGGKLWKQEEMKRWAEIVASVGGKSLRVAHPWNAWNYDESLHQKASWNEIFDLAKGGLPNLMALGKEYGIRFVLELHAGGLTASALAAAKFLEGCDSRYVGVIYDPANTVIEGFMRPRNQVEVLGKYLAYVHAKNVTCNFTGEFIAGPVRRAKWEYKTCTPSNGILDYMEVGYALKLGGFDGWISFEEFFRAPEAGAQLKDALEFMKECERHAPGRPQPPYTTFND
jgi:sugar phosphate isomerase/epimerase